MSPARCQTADGPFRRVRAAFLRMRRRLRARPDSEHEITLNRVVFTTVVVAFLMVATRMGSEGAALMLERTALGFAAYAFLSIAIFLHILWDPGVNVPRRIAAMVIDVAIISLGAWGGDGYTGFFYPLYLWAVFGNGFRFGVRYLYLAMAMSIVGFGIVIYESAFWSSNLGLSLALLVGLGIVPLYAAVLIRKLSEAKRLAEQANRAKSQFLAAVSHELRTPLNAIIGFSDLLARQPLPRQEAEMVRTIAGAGRSLLTQINGILDFSRLEAGRMPSVAAAFDFHVLLHQLKAMLSVEANRKGLVLAVHLGAGVPRRVIGDAKHIEEILLNLGSNAVKFTERGHVLIAVEAMHPDQEDAARSDQVRLSIAVADTGIGIAPEAQARVFESFTQADETIIDRFGGTGLGLAIVRQLVDLLGGRIGLESALGFGSRFTVELPLDLAEAEAPALPAGARPVLLSADPNLWSDVRQLVPGVRAVADIDGAMEILTADAEGGMPPQVVLVDERRGEGEAGAAALLVGRLAVATQPPSPLVLIASEDGVPEPLADDLRLAAAARLARTHSLEALAEALAFAAGEGGSGEAMQADAASARPGRKLPPLRILIAEDNKTNQMVLGKILETAGHDSVAADNGEEALTLLREHRFDAVLMDVNMPVMNGIEATKLYRFMSLGRERVPIIGLTADATPEARARCLDAGMDACATKPIDVDTLLDVIASVLPNVSAVPAAVGARAAMAKLAAIAEPAPAMALDPSKLDDLEAIGGAEFVGELVEEFLKESDGLVRGLADAVADEDVHAFRQAAHALRSAAANVGAEQVFELCLGWREISPSEIAEDGERRVRVMVDALGEARNALNSRIERPAAPPAPRAARS